MLYSAQWQRSATRNEKSLSSLIHVQNKVAELQPRFRFIVDSLICVNQSQVDHDSFQMNQYGQIDSLFTN